MGVTPVDERVSNPVVLAVSEADYSRVRAFEIIFVLTLATEYWSRGIPKWSALSWQYVASAIAITVLVLPSLTARWRREAFAAMGAIHLYIGWREFPATANHTSLELTICALGALLDIRRAEDRALIVLAVRWVVCVIFFYSGLQKVVHGYWFQGQYLTYALSSDADRRLLRYLLPSAEAARMTSYTGAVGDGPYLVSAPLFLAATNVVWVLELLAAPLLLARRTRPMAIVVCVLLMLGIESAARELFFGLVFVNGLLLFTPRDVHSRLVVPVCVVLALLLLSRLGVLPAMVFT